MQKQTLDAWLEDLASRSPAPGGGAAAAMNAAIGAALVSMVCQLTIGKPRYAAHEQALRAALDKAERARVEALRLADEDAHAFTAVLTAYKLPKNSELERAARDEAIQQALYEAAEVPLRTARLAVELIALTEQLVDRVNLTVVSDVAVAASSAGAALEAAVVNVEVNLASLRESERRKELEDKTQEIAAATSRVSAVVLRVREAVSR